MAVFRERPYSQFAYLIESGTEDGGIVLAAFQEVSGLGMEVTVAEYRNDNDRENAPRKISGMCEAPIVTLKRGVISGMALFEWMDQLRNGNQQDALRTVTVHLQNGRHNGKVMSWKLVNAWPTKYTGPSLNSKGDEVAIEELTLACERIEVAT